MRMQAETVTLEFLNSLVQLTTRPEEEWVGLVVYHPMGQVGSTPYWRSCDEEPSMQEAHYDPEDEPDWGALVYDSGPVQSHEEGPWGPEARRDVLFYVEVCVGEPYKNVPNEKWPDGFCFRYGADNLWIERNEDVG